MASVYPILLFTNKIINSEIIVDSVSLEPCCKSRHRESERERGGEAERESEKAREREREFACPIECLQWPHGGPR